MGQLLTDLGLLPDTILSSTSQRTQETAELVAEAGDVLQAVEYDERLYLATSQTIRRVLSRVPNRTQSVMVVGHNPGLEDLIRKLTGRSETMPTAALAHLELPIESWNEVDGEVRGTLQKSWRPRDLVADD